MVAEQASEQLLEDAPLIVLRLDRHGHVEHANRYFRVLTGHALRALRGREGLATFLRPPDVERFTRLSGVTPGAEATAWTSDLLTNVGATRTISWRAQAVPGAVDPVTVVFGTEITDTRVARGAQVGGPLEESPHGIYELGLDARVVSMNQVGLQMFGASSEEEVVSRELMTVVRAREREPLRLQLVHALAGRAAHVEFETICGRIFDSSLVPLRDASGRVERLLGIAVDVTEQRRSAVALRESEARLAVVFNSTNDLEVLLRVEGGRLVVEAANRAYRAHRGLGGGSEQELVGHDRTEILESRGYTAAEIDAEMPMYRQVIEHGKAVDYRIVVPHPACNTTLDVTIQPVLDAHGRCSRVLWCGRDVTDRMRAEEELRTHSRVLLAMSEGVQFVGTDCLIRFANPALAAMFGYSPEELVGKHISLLKEGAPEETARQIAEIVAVLQATGTYEGIARNRRKDGTAFWSRLRITVLQCEGEALWVTLHEDITQREEVEEDVRRTRDLLRQVIDSSPDLIYVKDLEHRVIVVNEAMARSRGCRVDEMVGRPDTDFWPARTCHGDPSADLPGFHEGDLEALAGRSTHNRNSRVCDLDGTWGTFDTFKTPLRDEGGTPYAVFGLSRDVTEERAADARLQSALAEKETLLREIHHRVKNNLQIISGLMYFQAKKVHDPRDVAVFAEGRARLLAMMLVHDKLYQSDNLAQVDLDEYIRGLARALADSLVGGGRVKVEVVVSSTSLPAERALSVGMILCELLTNVFKHALPEGGRGEASVRVHSDRLRAHLIVRDDGRGFSPDFDPLTTTSFGWHLVRNLVAQLGGAVTASNDRGALVEVSFPISRPEEAR